jgi:hypothetical protein
VVGHNVDNQAHAELLQAFSEVGELFLRANFGVETGVVGDVITVGAAGMGHQKRRGVAIGDSQIMQVRDYRSGLGKRKTLVELKTIGGTRDIRRF